MITLEDVIEMVIVTSIYWDTNTDIDTAVEYTLNDYENDLSITLNTLRAMPTEYPGAIQNIEGIFSILRLNDEIIVEALTKHIALIKLGKIL